MTEQTRQAIERLEKIYQPWLNSGFPDEFVEFQKGLKQLLIDSWIKIDELYAELAAKENYSRSPSSCLPWESPRF